MRLPHRLLYCSFFSGLLAFLICSTSTKADDWPEFLGPNRNNRSSETGLRQSLSADGVPIVWQNKVGTGYSAPSIRGDRLVLHHRVGGEEIIETFSAVSGIPVWKHSYPSKFIDPFGYNNGPRCSPVLTEELCYTFGAEGLLLCLRLKDGSVVWQRDTRADFNIPEAFFGVGSTPVLEDGKLFLILGGQPNSAVIAVDASTGATVWENGGESTWNGVPMTGWPGERTVQWNPADPAFQKQASYCTPVLATIHGKRHLLCCTRQGLLSLAPATGKLNFAFWFRSRQDSSVNAMSPLVQNDCILLSSAYFRLGSVLLRVRPSGDAVDEVWRGTQLEMHWSQPILEKGALYGFSGRNEPDARFRCVDWADGRLRWDRFEGWPNAGHSKLREGEKPPEFYGRGSLIFAAGKLIALGEAGRLGLFDLNPEKPGELGFWQVPGLSYPCWTGPVLSNRKLYLRDESLLMCLDWAEPAAK